MPRIRTIDHRVPAGLLLALAALGAPSPIIAADPSATPGPSGDITGIDWRLAQVAGSGVPFIDVPAGVDATLRIDGDRATGSGGCNQWSANALVDGAAVAFGEVLSTAMACEEPRMQFESAYLGFLDDIRAWAITDDGRLELADANGAVLLVLDGPATAGSPGPVALVGTPWRVVTLVSGGITSEVPPGIDVTLTIDETGQASGTAACNGYGGPAAIDGDALTFGGLAVTEMACPEPRMTLERAWLDVLAATASWHLDGMTLELRDATGMTLATLVPGAAA